MFGPAYAHAGQHPNCYRCETYTCTACTNDVCELCDRDDGTCQCTAEVHDLRFGETP